MDDPLRPLRLWEAMGSVDGPARGAVLLVAAGISPDLDDALDRPLAAVSAYAARELAQLCSARGPGGGPGAGGAVAETSVSCPGCRELLEVDLDLAALAAEFREPVPALIEVADAVVRAPTTRDLLGALAAPDPADALRRACVRTAGTRDGQPSAEPSAELRATSEQLAGLAALAVRVTCPECGHQLRAEVDLVGLLAEQVTDQAHRLLTEVAELAAAYGWSESDVLALSGARRRAYLGLARSQPPAGGGRRG